MIVIEAYLRPDRFGYAIRVGQRDAEHHIAFVADPITMKTYTPGSLVQPCIELDREDLQGLADNLWRLGFVPSQTLLEKNREKS